MGWALRRSPLVQTRRRVLRAISSLKATPGVRIQPLQWSR